MWLTNTNQTKYKKTLIQWGTWIMGQITATRNLVATKVVRHAGQRNKCYKQLICIYISHVNVTQTVPAFHPWCPCIKTRCLVALWGHFGSNLCNMLVATQWIGHLICPSLCGMEVWELIGAICAMSQLRKSRAVEDAIIDIEHTLLHGLCSLCGDDNEYRMCG